MICSLCLKEKELVKKSHIIPDFMYKDLFDDKHRLYEASVKDREIKSKTIQSGGYEGDILCSECDNKVLGQLERYASMILYGDVSKVIQTQVNEHGITCTFCKEIDYTKFKLFLLSLLWRASISKLKMFKNVSLGPHEGIIRNMILNGNPGTPKKYPCLMITYLNNSKFPNQLIGQPALGRKDGSYTYYFLVGGILYIFFVSSHKIPTWIEPCVINSDGELRVVHMSNKIAEKTINSFLGVEIYGK